ncbi:YifB family Mg chelatase-like AAA ATPase [Pseudactinotalea sp. HY160]|nr:YifB family Mg chelatase-like AAA ATPase [Pseudactinotalea sp. HY160]
MAREPRTRAPRDPPRPHRDPRAPVGTGAARARAGNRMSRQGLGSTMAVSLVGLQGDIVGVEAQVSDGLPQFRIVGLPDTTLAEARDRVRAAIQSTGLTWALRRITVGLTPAELPKSGSIFDLAIAVAVLRAQGSLPGGGEHVHLGELGLDGALHPVRGILPAVAAAVARGRPRIVVPAANRAEAELVPGARVVGAGHLAEVVRLHGGRADDAPAPPVAAAPAPLAPAAPAGGLAGPADLADVVGQHEARAALEIAAAGGHHLFMSGPPGTGKTMLAARLPGLLPDLSEAQAIEVTGIHSMSGTFDPARGLLRRPPFEAPHHSATMASIVGGGSGIPRPGSASRAHLGVLFLDESPEFAPHVLDSLRQPLEHGELVLQRSYASARYPARFQLVLAANPCPCGKGSGKGIDCTCSAQVRRRYENRLSGPLLDRVDIRVTVGRITRVEAARAGEDTATVAARVRRARHRQRERLAGTPWGTNGEVPGPWLRERTGQVAPDCLRLLERQLDQGRLSLRGIDRVLRLAWTVADLAGAERPRVDHLGTALVLRSGGEHDPARI